MCQANTSMKIRQDAVKAALAASCFDVHYTPSETGYRTWGNGALNSRYAWTVAKDSQFRYGIITSTDPATFTYTFSTSSASTYEFVALTNLRYSKFSSGDHTGDPVHDGYPPDLDLRVYNNSTNALVASSTMGTCWNVEKVGFPTGGANTFRIEVTHAGERSQNGYFGVAWY